MTSSQRNNKILFTGNKIIKAILFHIEDEKWLDPIPVEIIEWLMSNIQESRKYWLKRDSWLEAKTGTHKLLWLIIAAKLDPYELCKYTSTPSDARAMHQRFSNIISAWENPTIYD